MIRLMKINMKITSKARTGVILLIGSFVTFE